jgi:hypothetical protein
MQKMDQMPESAKRLFLNDETEINKALGKGKSHSATQSHKQPIGKTCHDGMNYIELRCQE